jgi:hypothetical protein
MVLVPPGGASRGRIKYGERLAPVATFADWLARTLGDGFREERRTARETLSTREGEFAARVVVDGHWLGEPARRCIGAVLGDDAIALVDALALGDEERAGWDALSRELLAGVTLRLGVRRRRFPFAPPRGWLGLASGLSVTYYPPGYPADASQLTVHPAAPHLGATVDDVVARLAADERARGRVFTATAERLLLDSGLAGVVVRGTCTSEGRTLHRDQAVLGAGAYLHQVRLDSFTPSQATRAAFTELVASCRPIAAAEGPPPALAHWVD